MEEEFSKGHRTYKAFENGLEVIRLIKGLQQYEREVNDRVKTIVKEEEALKAELEETTLNLVKTKQQTEQAVEDARKESEEIISEARRKAQEELERNRDDLVRLSSEKSVLSNEIQEKESLISELNKSLSDLERQKSEALAKIRAALE